MNRPTIEQYAAALFDPGEHTCFTNTPYGTSVFALAAGIRKPPAYFSINPLRPGSRRLDDNVVAYRNILVECDTGSLPEQMDYIRELAMPFTTLVFSGGKSLHFVISLATALPDRAAYKALVERVHAVVTRCDHKTKNPSRLARWPSHFREDKGKWQHLLLVKNRVDSAALDSWLTAHGALPRTVQARKRRVTPVAVGRRLWPLGRTLVLLKEGAPEGVRNDETYVAAHDLFRCGYTLEEATDKLVTALVALDFAEREIVRTIESAWAKHERELQP